MKAENVRSQGSDLEEIVRNLKSVPKSRLHIVRDIVDVLAQPSIVKGREAKSRSSKAKTLLKTSFCGMWQGRTDIGNGQSYARTLRHTLEKRGDRR